MKLNNMLVDVYIIRQKEYYIYKENQTIDKLTNHGSSINW